MKISRSWRWGCFLIFLLLIWRGRINLIYGQNGQGKIPEEIFINQNKYITDIYEGVLFKHRVHALESGIPCKNCHHTWDQEKKKKPEKCSNCHEIKKEKNKPGLRDAYMNKCRGCHAKLKREGKPSGPTRCNGCHLKKKRIK